MVHPYLRRRNGLEPVEFPSKELENILGKTLGVPLFQEQAMQVAIVAAGFTPSEADALRRSMATFKAQGQVSRFQEKLIDGMIAKGYTREYAERIFRQLEGFGSYGFPESHAVSFALLVYISAWLKCYYPDVFACALLNSLPMGFYQPAQIVIDARKHGVEVLPVDVNYSQWDHLLEPAEDPNPGQNPGPGPGRYRRLRLGFRQITGVKEEDAQALVTGRTTAPTATSHISPPGRATAPTGISKISPPAFYTTLTSIRDAGVSQTAMEKLADADAFRSMGLDRRKALWEVAALNDRPMALFASQPGESTQEPEITLPAMSAAQHVVQDYASTSLSLKAHPVSFVREKLDLLHIVPAGDLAKHKDGDVVKVAGLILVRQQPGTASGVVFITIEDETGTANLVTFHGVFQAYRKTILQSRLLMVEGKLQIEGEVIHVIVKHCHNLSPLLRDLVTPASRDFK
jgi:error-prone DNA polymerase